MTAKVPGYYGSDHADRRFHLAPQTATGGNLLGQNANEKYFTIVKRDDPGKGTILVYNEELGQDRLVGWQKPGQATVTPYNGQSKTEAKIVNGSKVYTQVSTSTPPQELPPGLVNPQTGYSVAGNIKTGARKWEITAFNNSQNAKLVNQSGKKQIEKDIIDGVNGSEKGTVAEARKTAEDLTQSNAGNATADREMQGMLKLAYDNLQNREGTNTNFNTKSLKYPLNLHEKLQDCIKFSVMEYQPSKFKQGGGVLGGFEEHDRGGGGLGGAGREWKDRKKLGSVVLPIPGGIREDNTVDWGDSTMNPIEAAFAKIGLDFLTSEDAVGTVGKAMDEVKRRQREVGGGLAMAIAQSAVGGTGRLLTRETGAVMNPNMQLLFKQPQLRPFTFEFQFTPRESKESREVMKIIRLFKQAMAPIRSDSMLFLKSPHTFRLEYLHENKPHPYVGSIKECALLTCGVDYTPNNNYSTYEDGVMTAYTLSLQFKELVPVYNDDYGTSNAANLNFSGAMSSEEQSPTNETATSSTFTTNSTELGLGANDLSGSSSNIG